MSSPVTTSGSYVGSRRSSDSPPRRMSGSWDPSSEGSRRRASLWLIARKNQGRHLRYSINMAIPRSWYLFRCSRRCSPGISMMRSSTRASTRGWRFRPRILNAWARRERRLVRVGDVCVRTIRICMSVMMNLRKYPLRRCIMFGGCNNHLDYAYPFPFENKALNSSYVSIMDLWYLIYIQESPVLPSRQVLNTIPPHSARNGSIYYMLWTKVPASINCLSLHPHQPFGNMYARYWCVGVVISILSRNYYWEGRTWQTPIPGR